LVGSDAPWIGRVLADDPRPFVVITLRHADAPVGLLWALPVAGTSETWLETRRSTYLEFAAFVTVFAGSDLYARRSVQRSRRAIEQVIADRAFAPVFQPVVELASRQVIGYEALTRFDDGMRPDLRFAEAAEVGLGVALEATTLRSAFSSARGLPAGTWLSVNVSPELLLAVVPLVAALEGFEADLVLELTEHVAIDDYNRLREAIALLGTRADVSIDDAGSGYASLRHILELGPRYVKLDISLVRSIESDAARQGIVAGLVHFATTTGCELIAEGIDTEPQLAALRRLGIRYGQGYLLGRPGPLPEAVSAEPERPLVATRVRVRRSARSVSPLDARERS
jgi:EAL domain-containing protein (putative c-di-GMP-specific phosphodiesterase class I)